VPFSQGKRVDTDLAVQKKYGKGVQVSAQQLGITRLPGNFPDKTESASSGQSDQAETLF
jgi:hypothetical protein